jgi:hypothetical protein
MLSEDTSCAESGDQFVPPAPPVHPLPYRSPHTSIGEKMQMAVTSDQWPEKQPPLTTGHCPLIHGP